MAKKRTASQKNAQGEREPSATDWFERQKSKMGVAGNTRAPQKSRNPLAEEEAIEVDETRAD